MVLYSCLGVRRDTHASKFVFSCFVNVFMLSRCIQNSRPPLWQPSADALFCWAIGLLQAHLVGNALFFKCVSMCLQVRFVELSVGCVVWSMLHVSDMLIIDRMRTYRINLGYGN